MIVRIAFAVLICAGATLPVGISKLKAAPASSLTEPSGQAASAAAVESPLAQLNVVTPRTIQLAAVVQAEAEDKAQDAAAEKKAAEDKAAAEEKAAKAEKPDAKGAPPPRKEMLKTAGRGVVLVNSLDALGEKNAFGSGCVVGKNLVLTNYHVIESAVTCTVQPLGESDELLGAPLKVTGYRALDDRNDLGLLVVEGLPEKLHTFVVADSSKVEKFDQVFAIGHPEGLKFTITSGFVNGLLKGTDLPEQIQPLMRDVNVELLQTDAVIAGGSSGGPLINDHGEIVGINTYLINARTTLAVSARYVKELLAKQGAAVVPLPVPDADVLVTKAVAQIANGFNREHEQFLNDLRREQSEKNTAEFDKLFRENNPAPRCLIQCQELIKEQRGKPEAADAVRLCASVLTSTGGHVARHYFNVLLEEAARDPGLIPATINVFNSLYSLDYSVELEHYLRSVLKGEAPAASKAVAGVALIGTMLRKGELQGEVLELAHDISEHYGDQLFQSKPIKDQLQSLLDSQKFAVGSIAPDIIGKDHEGKEFRLSDYRGKVVVLDFWADWCPHCRNMYGSQRDLIERLKDKPFVMLGVNGDEEDRARKVIKEGKVTWRSWLDGHEGPIARDWMIQAWPTTYVLDQDGRIQFKDVRDDDLEAAVQSLLSDAPYPLTQSILPANARWSYSTVTDAKQPADWRQAEFDDAQWASGPGPLGYGDLKFGTKLEQTAPGSRPLVRLFRTRFDLPATEKPAQLLMWLRHRDGAAVYLNGTEVYRTNLTKTAGLDAAAANRVTTADLGGAYVLIDTAALKPTGNQLAVEVHGFSPYSSSLVMDLSLGTVPDLATLVTTATTVQKIQICRLIAELNGLPASDAVVKQLQTDKVPAVQFQAAVAAAMSGFPVTIAKYTDQETNQQLMQFLVGWNESAWDVAEREGLSLWQYRAALRQAKASIAMIKLLLPQVRARMSASLNTLGVAQYRAGEFAEAQKTLKKSLKTRGENPIDTAYLALVLWQLDQKEEAEKQRANYVKLITEDKWKHDFPSIGVKQELDRVFQN